MGWRRQRDFAPYLIGLIIGGALLVGLGLAVRGVVAASRAKVVRCYALEQPLTQAEKEVLDGDLFVCAPHLCRVAMRVYPNRGLACYFPRPLAARSGWGPVTRTPSIRSWWTSRSGLSMARATRLHRFHVDGAPVPRQSGRGGRPAPA